MGQTVVRRFVGERAIDVQWKSMSNGFDVHRAHRGGHQIHWTSISIGHQLRVHRQIVTQLILVPDFKGSLSLGHTVRCFK